MIYLNKLNENNKGAHVVYKAGSPEEQEGTISSWNDYYIFVRYWNTDHTQLGHSQATRPSDLSFKLAVEEKSC